MTTEPIEPIEPTELQCHCSKCGVIFVRHSQLKGHSKEYHSAKVTVNYPYSAAPTVVYRREDGTFPCICGGSYATSSSFRRHVKKNICQGAQRADSSSLYSSNDDEIEATEDENPDGDDIESTLDMVDARLPQTLKCPAASTLEPLEQSHRSYEHAILHACGVMHLSQDEAKRHIKFIDALDLKPIALIDQDGNEENCLVSNEVIERLSSTHSNFSFHEVNPTKKRKISSTDELDADTPQQGIHLDASLSYVIDSSPYAHTLQSETYIELNSEICELLNTDWLMGPQLRYFCAQVFAGAILLESETGQAMLVNSIEVYGRTISQDVHRERYIFKDETLRASSLPPVDSIYPNVCVSYAMYAKNRSLVIGTKTFGGYITSGVMLNGKSMPEIGPSFSQFVLTKHLARNIKIYINKKSFEDAQIIANNRESKQLYGFAILSQLRNLRSLFHCPSTYIMCRATSRLMNDHPTRPYTIFTYADSDKVPLDSDARVASELFQTVALAVLDGGYQGTLEKNDVLRLRKRCEEGEIYDCLQNILDLYLMVDDCSSISILGNRALNLQLTNCADLLWPSLAIANEAVVQAIADTLEKASVFDTV
ncbi:C2H2-type zinc finger transcription factor [Phycomyces blakesleeanus]|uniref:C2H2-type zinc finger transcription factor n=2 Tax=Phycomyces blakesleeanus TaxID=4837 RepID=A0A167P8K5_PHYB8|nr:C2H2-type zinc finger transcription factor [Phycomyces blakesleeanus NRRL 1555(-)]OAD77469.1 C2H2-type zinc finger transcription factor [Phycomyces blakesleeanus NRRL 1555(-)]|eukprot:XP_018295509.1 C2H2-type zinc finger transcription factor [Phycomyces blakesleeanus NRRL 1555(-)]